MYKGLQIGINSHLNENMQTYEYKRLCKYDSPRSKVIFFIFDPERSYFIVLNISARATGSVVTNIHMEKKIFKYFYMYDIRALIPGW